MKMIGKSLLGPQHPSAAIMTKKAIYRVFVGPAGCRLHGESPFAVEP